MEAPLFFIFAALFFWFGGPVIVNRLFKFHTVHNPKLVEKAPGIFTGFKIFFKVFSFLCLILALLILFGLL